MLVSSACVFRMSPLSCSGRSGHAGYGTRSVNSIIFAYVNACALEGQKFESDDSLLQTNSSIVLSFYGK